MKEFIAAYEDVEADEEYEAKVKTLMDAGKTREEAEEEVDDEPYIEFKLDDRVMRAYDPLPGQLVFMMASLGRGQSKDQRFAAIMNIMMESLREDDKDYFESRLLTRDKKRRLGLKDVESIFEYVTSEWFARPTQSPSDSAG